MGIKMRGLRVALALAMVAGVLTGTSSLGAAAPAPEVGIALSLEGRPIATVGELVYGTTMVSVKDLAQDLGLTVRGPGASQVTVTYKGKELEFNLGGSWTVVNGHEVICPMVPTLDGDRVMVPLRFLLENLGFAVKWIGGTPSRVDIRPVSENALIIGTIRETQVTGTLKIDVQYPRLAGLAAAIQDPINAFFESRVRPVIDQGYQSEKDSLASADYRWQTEVFANYTVAYNQKGLLSLVFDDYLYCGGAHGGTTRTGYTVDIASGKTYALKDLFAPGADYVSRLSAEVTKQIKAQGIEPLTPFTAIRADQDFYINNDDCLVVFFRQYELMPYAFGFPEFKVPLASLKDILAPDLAARDWAE